ncbi:phosphotransferase [soil metagenome]
MVLLPGFAGDEASLTPLTAEQAIGIADEVFGVTADTAVRLETERDDTFRIGDYVLKIAHPSDPFDVIDFQTQALLHASATDASLPLQHVHRSRSGDLQPLVNGRIARMFSWLPGTLVQQFELDDAELALLGATLARLARALRGFDHPAARRPLAWDLLQFDSLRQLLASRPELGWVFERYDEVVVPRVGELPMQVIHNDFHPENVLASRSDPGFVSGILDFGDAILSARVADVAVACAYLPAAGIRHFVAGYQRITALEPVELEVLPHLVTARLAARILINEWLAPGSPSDRMLRALDALKELEP